MIYLAGPIDLAGDTSYRERMIEVAHTLKINVFDPAGAFKLSDFSEESDMERLVSINKDAMLTCSGSLFVFAHDQPSIGTPMELMMSSNAGQPNVVLWKQKDGNSAVPAYIQAFADHVIVAHRLDHDEIAIAMKTLHELTEKKEFERKKHMIEGPVSGEVEIDTDNPVGKDFLEFLQSLTD